MTSSNARLVRAGRVLPALVGIVLLLVVTVRAVTAVQAGTDGRFVYALDDAYIHMAMAMTLARDAVWGARRSPSRARPRRRCGPRCSASCSARPGCTTRHRWWSTWSAVPCCS